jgi:hypothetical protein
MATGGEVKQGIFTLRGGIAIFFLQGVMQKSSTLQMGENLLTLKNMYSSFQLRLNDNTIA